eukprot:1247980-Pyramimonas_sp.AAC.1
MEGGVEGRTGASPSFALQASPLRLPILSPCSPKSCDHFSPHFWSPFWPSAKRSAHLREVRRGSGGGQKGVGRESKGVASGARGAKRVVLACVCVRAGQALLD